MTSDFISGLELSKLFYLEAVKPIMDADYPNLRYERRSSSTARKFGFRHGNVRRPRLGSALDDFS
jgi:hypothetical protein